MLSAEILIRFAFEEVHRCRLLALERNKLKGGTPKVVVPVDPKNPPKEKVKEKRPRSKKGVPKEISEVKQKKKVQLVDGTY